MISVNITFTLIFLISCQDSMRRRLYVSQKDNACHDKALDFLKINFYLPNTQNRTYLLNYGLTVCMDIHGKQAYRFANVEKIGYSSTDKSVDNIYFKQTYDKIKVSMKYLLSMLSQRQFLSQQQIKTNTNAVFTISINFIILDLF